MAFLTNRVEVLVFLELKWVALSSGFLDLGYEHFWATGRELGLICWDLKLVFLLICLVRGMTPSLDFSNWWGKETRKGTPVVVTMENPNYSVVAIDGPDAAFRPVDKDRGKNAKQFTWVLLLRAHRAVGCLTWVAGVLWALLGAVKKRLIFRQGMSVELEKSSKGRLLFRFIGGFLVVSMAILVFEMVAHLNGWHFRKPNLHIPRTSEIEGWMHKVYLAWLAFRVDYIAPPIQALSNFCVALFLIQSVDRLILCIGCFWIKYKKIKPRIEGGHLKSDDVEKSGYVYPMVLVQIPMCNEREVTDFTSLLLIFLFFILFFPLNSSCLPFRSFP